MPTFQLTYRGTVDYGGGEKHVTTTREMFDDAAALAALVVARTVLHAPDGADATALAVWKDLADGRRSSCGEDAGFGVVSVQKLGPLTLEEMRGVFGLIHQGLAQKAKDVAESVRVAAHDVRIARCHRRIATARAEALAVDEYLRAHERHLNEDGLRECEGQRVAAAQALAAAESALASLLARPKTPAADVAEEPIQQSLPLGE
jgi:hypothetical protein